MAEQKKTIPQASRKTGNDERKEAIQTAIAQIEKNFGKGAIMRLGEKTSMNIECIPTGSMTVDIALGGGLPKGRIVEIYGPESSGKTTLALHCIAQAQMAGGEAAFVDAEHALDPVYAGKLGVDIDSLLLTQPSSGEEALEITEQLVRTGAIDMIVVDSVAALVPRAELEGEMGDSHVGLHARLMSQALRKLAGVISKTGCVVIFINQLREKVGISYGNPEVTTGGRALKFYASVRIDIRKKEPIKIGVDIVGNKTHAKIVKNKVAPPFKEADFDIMYGLGISREGEVIDLAERLDVIKKSGTWFSYKETRLGQGKENVKIFMQQNPEIMLEIETEILSHKDEINSEAKTVKTSKTIKSKTKVDVVADEDDDIDDVEYEGVNERDE